jgi:hypothetical protein
MDDRDILTILIFGLGIVFQAVNLIKGKPDNWKIAGCLLFTLFAFFPGQHLNGDYNFPMHLLISFFYFVLAFAILFKDDILPAINERTLLIFTMIFWYAHISFAGLDMFYFQPITWFAAPFSALVLFHAFAPVVVGFRTKVWLYVWFLISVTSVSYQYFSASFLQTFWNSDHLYQVTALDAFLTGSTFLYLGSNIFYLTDLIPIPGKRQKWSDRMKQWREYIQLLGKKYEGYQLRVWQSAGILVFLGSLFSLNYVYQFLAPQLLLSFALVVLSLSERVGVLLSSKGK